MPRNSSGIYTLPVAPFTPGTVITASAQNSNFDDIADALTDSMATSGVSHMTAPIRAFPGDDDTASYAIRGNLDTGFYLKGSNNVAAIAGGNLVWEWTTAALILSEPINVASLTINGVANQGFAAGNVGIFVNTNAPLGWSKVTTYHDRLLRVVSGTAGIGGTQNFAAVFKAEVTFGCSLSATTLSVGQTPAHRHLIVTDQARTIDGDSIGPNKYMARTLSGSTFGDLGYEVGGTSIDATLCISESQGEDQSHNHDFSYTPLNLNVQYMDVIFATKDA